jgi:uncharacterized Zn finger protein (UPF0148 family)
MDMPEITCPRCGYSLESAGSIATTCPRCESSLQFEEQKPVARSSPANAAGDSQSKLDAAALMRQVLAEQRPGEDLDAVLERIAKAEDPQAREKIIKAIESFLSFRQQQLGISRQEAAQLLAGSMAQLSIMPDGNPFLEGIDLKQGMATLTPEFRQQLLQQIEKSFREGKPLPTPIITGIEKVKLTNLNIQGIEKLAPKYQQQIQQQIEEAIREGKPIPTTNITLTVNLGKLSPSKVLILTALLLGCLLLAYLLSLR